MFTAFDANANGQISPRELQTLLASFDTIEGIAGIDPYGHEDEHDHNSEEEDEHGHGSDDEEEHDGHDDHDDHDHRKRAALTEDDEEDDHDHDEESGNSTAWRFDGGDLVTWAAHFGEAKEVAPLEEIDDKHSEHGSDEHASEDGHDDGHDDGHGHDDDHDNKATVPLCKPFHELTKELDVDGDGSLSPAEFSFALPCKLFANLLI